MTLSSDMVELNTEEQTHHAKDFWVNNGSEQGLYESLLEAMLSSSATSMKQPKGVLMQS